LCSRGEPRNFICLAAVSRGIYQIRRGICQISPRKIVGPSDNILTLATSAPRSAVRKNLTILAETSLPPRRAAENLPLCRWQTSLPPRRAPENLPPCPRQTSLPPRRAAEKPPLPPRRAAENHPNARRAPNNEMSLEVTQHNYVDDIGHRAPGRAITYHFLITP